MQDQSECAKARQYTTTEVLLFHHHLGMREQHGGSRHPGLVAHHALGDGCGSNRVGKECSGAEGQGAVLVEARARSATGRVGGASGCRPSVASSGGARARGSGGVSASGGRNRGAHRGRDCRRRHGGRRTGRDNTVLTVACAEYLEGDWVAFKDSDRTDTIENDPNLTSKVLAIASCAAAKVAILPNEEVVLIEEESCSDATGGRTRKEWFVLHTHIGRDKLASTNQLAVGEVERSSETAVSRVNRASTANEPVIGPDSALTLLDIAFRGRVGELNDLEDVLISRGRGCGACTSCAAG